MNFGKIAWISVLTAWVLATLYGALLATSAGNAEPQVSGQLLTFFRQESFISRRLKNRQGRAGPLRLLVQRQAS